MINFKSFAKVMVILSVLLSVSVSLKGQTPQGRRPTIFPDLPQLTDSTLLFTQDSTLHQSYKFTLGKLKSFVGKSNCLDSSFANTNDCIPIKQIKSGDSNIYYHNTLSEIFGDTSGMIELCDATAEFPNLLSQVISINGNTFDADTSMYCSTGFAGGYSFSQDFPVEVRICESGYISQIRVRAIISNYVPSFEIEPPQIIVLALNVNGQNVTTSNAFGGGDTPETISILGIWDGPESYEFIYDNLSGLPINTVRATFMWLSGASFNLDGLQVTYKIANCPCTQKFLTTDSLGCMKLDSVILPEPFVLEATNGLSLHGDNEVKLGGTMMQNTTLNGNGNQLNFNGFNNINLNSYYQDDNNPNINFSSNFQQTGTYSNQSVWRGDNSNNQDESSGYYISPNQISQNYNSHSNSYNTQKNSQIQVSDNITQSSSFNDNINGVNNYTSSQFYSSGYTINTSNYITNEYSNHSLSHQSISFNTYGANNNFTGYNQSQNDIGIKASDYSQNGITQFRLTPLAVYLQTHKVFNSSATIGQILTLKDASTGEVEFEDITTLLDSIGNSDTSHCINAINGLHKDSCNIKLGGLLTENTIIDGLNKEFSFNNNHRFFINNTSLNNMQLDQLGGYISKTHIASFADNDSTKGLQITGAANGNVQNIAGTIVYGSNSGYGNLSGGLALFGHHTGYGINTIGTKLLGENVKGYGVYIEGKTEDTTNIYSDILIKPVNSRLKIINLNLDNSANQVLAKDSSGISVWRDINSIKPYNYTPTSSTDTYGNVGDVAYDADYVYVRTSSGWKRTALGTW